MQNKTKLILVVAVLLGGILLGGNTLAADCECGSANGGNFTDTPKENLCKSPSVSQGTPTLNGTEWLWYCSYNSCGLKTCSAAKKESNYITITPGCCCEDTVEKRCAIITCSEDCAGAVKHTTTCTAIPDYATKCNGTGACTPDCSCASSTAVGSTCSDKCGGTCKGTKGSGPTTPTGPIIPSQLAGLPTNPNLVKGIATNVANFLLSIIGIIAIISFVISGIQYFLVATDEKMMETAKKTMVASIIGLVVALFGYIAVKTIEMLLKG
jgi:hypothetical protein